MFLSESQLKEAVKRDVNRNQFGIWDLNPYSTDSSRASWEKGFAGEPIGYSYPQEYRRGQLARAELDAQGLNRVL
jgi:hypothetical protein